MVVNIEARYVPRMMFAGPTQAQTRSSRALAYDFETLQQLSQNLPDHSPLGNQARAAANDIMNVFSGSLEEVAQCRSIANRVLGHHWESAYTLETMKKEPIRELGNLWAIGYCHIDTAW